MTKGIAMKLIPSLMLAAFAGSAAASGFQLLEQNASGLGNAYAGSAANAENASTVFFNPAGLTQLNGLQVSAGGTLITTSFKFRDEGSSVGALQAAGNGNDGGGTALLPNMYGSYRLTDKWAVGLGIGAPFGLKTEFDKPWMGGAQANSFEIVTFNVNPSVAYKVNDMVSVGLGLNYQELNATYKRNVAVVPLLGGAVPASVAAASDVKMVLDGETWGWNGGVLVTLSPATKLGFSYRSTMKYKLDGTSTTSSPVAALAAATSTAVRTTLTLPDTAVFSVSQTLSDKWELLGDVSWTGWSSIPKLDIYRAPAGTVAQTLDTNFRNAWRGALGANYKLNDDWKLKFGVAYDQTPVKGAATRLVSLPDNNRTWFSAGAQWKMNKVATLDVGGAYLYLKDAKIDNDQSLQGRGRVTGTYSDYAWLLGAQLSVAF